MKNSANAEFFVSELFDFVAPINLTTKSKLVIE